MERVYAVLPKRIFMRVLQAMALLALGLIKYAALPEKRYNLYAGRAIFTK
jgi:hypothetical protein